MPAHFASLEMSPHFASLFQDLQLTTGFPRKEKKEPAWFKEPTNIFREPTLTHKEASWLQEQSELKQGKALKAAAHQVLSQNQPPTKATGPRTSEEPVAFRPRTSEEPKLNGLNLLPLSLKTPLLPSKLEEPAAPGCRNVKRIDGQTVIPEFVFEGMMKLGKKAEKRGAHEWTRRKGTRGVLRLATADSERRNSI